MWLSKWSEALKLNSRVPWGMAPTWGKAPMTSFIIDLYHMFCIPNVHRKAKLHFENYEVRTRSIFVSMKHQMWLTGLVTQACQLVSGMWKANNNALIGQRQVAHSSQVSVDITRYSKAVFIFSKTSSQHWQINNSPGKSTSWFLSLLRHNKSFRLTVQLSRSSLVQKCTRSWS